MNSINTFLSAALPWIAMGLMLAILFARQAKRKNNQSRYDDYGTEGMSLGMCLGVSLAASMHFDIGLGMMAGMLAGLIIGSYIEREE